MSSSSEDDIPLSQLIKREESTNGAKASVKRKAPKAGSARPPAPKGRASKGGSAKAKAREDSDSEDDVPLSSLIRQQKPKKTGQKRKVVKTGGAADEDSEDEISLAALRRSIKKEGSSRTAPAKKRIKRESPRPARATVSGGSSSGGVPVRRSGGGGTAWSAFYETTKGELVQKLLCRWWYTMEWPGPCDAPDGDYLELDGFRGVYICASGDEIGKIIDKRDMSTCPNMKNFSRMGVQELKDKLCAALRAQKLVLQEKEGPGTRLESELDRDLRWASRVDAPKADKEAIKWARKWKMDV